MRVLSVNAGSSSLKLALIGEGEQPLAASEIELADGELDEAALRRELRGPLGDAEAVGHRIVHGGVAFTSAVEVDEQVRRKLQALRDLAPLHQRKSLVAMEMVSALLGDVRSVACFDTAFHAGIAQAAATYALPERWRRRLAIRRYGFHGLSHAWVAHATSRLLGGVRGRLVSCHLGAGASLCAIRDGRSIDTTMGFTPLEGLVMATRSGSVDPGLLLWLMEHEGISERELAHVLEHESGLLGLCGSSDMREVLTRAEEGEGDAQLALQVYMHRLIAGVAAMAAALGGIDVLAFTGGVGESSASVRSMAASGLRFLGVEVDEGSNDEAGGDREISAAGARVRTLVVAAREDLEIARQTRALLRRAHAA